MDETLEINGTAVQKGDRIKFTGEGVVSSVAWGDVRVKMDGHEGEWWVNEHHTVTILEKAKPKEPTDLYTMVEGISDFGTRFRYVRVAENKWAFANAIGGVDTIRTWDFLMRHYDNGKRLTILEPGKTLA